MVASRAISTRLSARFALKYPFACAGLAFAGTTPPLPVAVARAGAVGSLGVGKLPPEAMIATVRAIRAETDGCLNINFITIFTTDAHIDACVALKPEIVSFHWGHPPRAWIDRLTEAGISVWEQIGSVDAAKLAVSEGVDAVIVQGSEAGGHNYGTLPLFALLPAVVDAVAPALVLAAGAISDGRGIAAALALGADGVWVGTRMIATQEADIAPGYKQALLEARGEDAVLSTIFGRDTPEFNPMRLLRNAIVREFENRDGAVPDDPSTQPVIGSMALGAMELPMHRFSNLLPMSSATGDLQQMPLLAGQGVDLVRDLPPAGELIDRMMGEAAEVLDRMAASRNA